MHIDFNENWPNSQVYNLQNVIQFETISPISNTKNGKFKHSDYPFIYIAVLLAVHMFDCDRLGN